MNPKTPTESEPEPQSQEPEPTPTVTITPPTTTTTIATTGSVFTSTPEQPQTQQEASPFDSMLDSEYNHILDQQISKALSKIQERFGRMMSQERGLGDKPKDRLGYNTDDYENMVKQIRAQDLNAGSSREEVYQQLYDLKFTEMRRLDLIKQEFNRGGNILT